MCLSSVVPLLKLLKAIQSTLKRLNKLMKTVDENIPTPAREVDKPFLMPIEDVSRFLVVVLLRQAVLSEVLLN